LTRLKDPSEVRTTESPNVRALKPIVALIHDGSIGTVCNALSPRADLSSSAVAVTN
jgi:hypothetical protein